MIAVSGLVPPSTSILSEEVNKAVSQLIWVSRKCGLAMNDYSSRLPALHPINFSVESYKTWTFDDPMVFDAATEEDYDILDKYAFKLYTEAESPQQAGEFKKIIAIMRGIFYYTAESLIAMDNRCSYYGHINYSKAIKDVENILIEAKAHEDLSKEMKECCEKIADAIKCIK